MLYCDNLTLHFSHIFESKTSPELRLKLPVLLPLWLMSDVIKTRFISLGSMLILSGIRYR